MKIEKLSFGTIEIDGKTFTEDIVINKGKISLRDKSVSRKYKPKFGHTPLTIEENIPWDCKTLIIGTGFYRAMPITKEVFEEAEKRNVKILPVNTQDIVSMLKQINLKETNFIIHLTC